MLPNDESCDDEEIEGYQHPETSDEESSPSEPECFIGGDFLDRKKSEFPIEEYHLVEPYDYDPGDEHRDEDACAGKPGIGEFGRHLSSVLDPFHPAVPLHAEDMDEREGDDDPESPPLEKPPCCPFHAGYNAFERKNEEENKEQRSEESRAERYTEQVESFLGEFEREEEIRDDRMHEREESSDDPDLLSELQQIVESIEISSDRSDEECEGENGHAGSGEHLVRDVEHIGCRRGVEEVSATEKEVCREYGRERESDEKRDEIISRTRGFVHRKYLVILPASF